MGGEREIEEGIDISEIRGKGEREKGGANVEDNTRLMEFREDSEVKGWKEGKGRMEESSREQT